MSWIITGSFAQPDEPEALAYIAAVEAADGQTLEDGVKFAYNSFIKGCKADGIWDAIKASCILAGARTLNGALVPLVGQAPSNPGNVFVEADYNRETGLKGDGSTKYLDSNRNNNADPQDSKHIVVFATQLDTIGNKMFLAEDFSSGSSQFFLADGSLAARLNSDSGLNTSIAASAGFVGVNRPSASNIQFINGAVISTFSSASATPTSGSIYVYSRSNAPVYSAHRLAFYSIGESLDLALLDSRVTTLMSDLAAAIP